MIYSTNFLAANSIAAVSATPLVLNVFLIIAGAIGHAGLVIAAYNRINATGISRITIKRIEKAILALSIVVPLFLLILECRHLQFQQSWINYRLHPTTNLYLWCVSIFSLVSLPLWISVRPCFTQASGRVQHLESQLLKPNSSSTNHGLNCIAGSKFAKMNRLPKNQISWTEFNRKQIRLDALPAPLQNLKIAHLSDIHFTGQMSNHYYNRAMRWINDQSPDLVVIAGDIVDYAHSLDRIEDVLGQLDARLGNFFVLGNHDRRLDDPLVVAERLVRMKWIDLGEANHSLSVQGAEVELLGNERPWFARHRNTPSPLIPTQASSSLTSNVSANRIRIGVSHSPDQFAWGIQEGCQLLLCGHTHGGQIRFPWIGPLIAPSWHGSRYASGTFYRHGTLMHVSRGLSGVHPFRWGCPPEISILEITS